MKVALTGGVSIEADGLRVDEHRFPGRQGRFVFAYLVAEHGRAVPRDELAEALWGDAPPVTWERGLTVVVSKLRGLLGECGLDGGRALTSAFGCYRLELPEGAWVDVLAAEESVEAAQAALSAGDLARAKAEAGEAAALARRTFLPGEDGDWVERKRRDLADVLTRALSCLADASLRSGDADDATRWAEEAVALEPFSEAGYRRLMQALAEAGNRAEALQVYERCRRLLADELGAYPSPETDAVYRELLRAPAPASEPASPPEAGAPAPASAPHPVRVGRGRRQPVRALGAAGVFLVLAAGATAFAVTRGGPAAAPVVVPPDTVGILDPAAGRFVALVPVGRRPVGLVRGRRGVWVANADDGTVQRIDPRSRAVEQTIGVGAPATDVALGQGAVWTGNGSEGTLSRLSPALGTVVDTVDVRGPSALIPNPVFGLVYGAGSLWTTSGRDVLRIDPVAGRVTAHVRVAGTPIAIGFGAGLLWVATTHNQLLRIEPRTNEVTGHVLVGYPAAIAVASGEVWVCASPFTTAGAVLRFTAGSLQLESSTAVLDPVSIAVGAGGAWVGSAADRRVYRIDPARNQVVATIRVGGIPAGIAVVGDAVWVSVDAPE